MQYLLIIIKFSFYILCTWHLVNLHNSPKRALSPVLSFQKHVLFYTSPYLFIFYSHFAPLFSIAINTAIDSINYSDYVILIISS